MEITIPMRQIECFLVAFFRTGGIMFSAPVLSSRAIPASVKVATSLIIALLLFPPIAAGGPALPRDPLILALVLGAELLIGFSIGLLAQIITCAVTFAGSILGMHMGLRIANVLDPQSEYQVSLMGGFFNIVAILLLMNLGFHVILIRLIKESFILIPPAGARLSVRTSEIMLRLGGDIFLFAIKFLAPMLAAIFLIEVMLAVVAKMARGFNVLMLQFPIKIALGVIVIGVSLGGFPGAVESMLKHALGAVEALLYSLR